MGGRIVAVRRVVHGIGSPEALADALRGAQYIACDGLATAAYLALALGRPLLLEGAPGVGKTEAAKALSAVLGRRLARVVPFVEGGPGRLPARDAPAVRPDAPQHHLGRDRQVVDVGADRVVDRVGDRRDDRVRAHLARSLAVEGAVRRAAFGDRGVVGGDVAPAPASGTG